MFWDSRPEYDCPAISKSSVSWDEPRGGFDAEVAKANLAGFICRREMSDTPNDEIAISADFAVCRERFNRYIGAGEDAFKLFIKDVEPIFTAHGCDIKLSQFCWTNCPARSGITQTPNEVAPAAPSPRQLQLFRHSR
jgi:hypothetical protein